MKFELYTAVICFLGWIAHWLFSWMEAWKTKRQGLIDFVDDNPPAFFFSIVVTVAVYMIGPAIFTVLGIDLPEGFSDPAVKGVIAFVAGYMADSFIYKVANLFGGTKSAG